ncbi:MAG TPA: sulfotransferase, partial [Gemmatimonadota bacterium]|nr:sulfotransferase [Gemmatimonadota bacterium]
MSPHELPHFLGIGAQKAATTWLDRCLRVHPGLWLPPIKELHYFTHRREDLRPGVTGRLLGTDWVNQRLRRILGRRLLSDVRFLDLAGLRWDLRFFLGSRSDAWYRSLFQDGSPRLTGEITPEYSSLSAEEVGRVREAFPHLKLLYMMRDPIDRAWSQIRMIARRRRWPLATMPEETALELARDSVVLVRSGYRSTLENWGLHFPPDQFFVAFLEDVQSSPRELLFDLFRFLGVESDDSFLPSDLFRPVHRGIDHPIPKLLELELARVHLDDLRVLEGRFGFPVSAWRERAERVLE